MCHDWWLRRRYEQRDWSSELWDEFEQTRPLSGDDVTEEEAEVTLEQPAPTEVLSER